MAATIGQAEMGQAQSLSPNTSSITFINMIADKFNVAFQKALKETKAPEIKLAPYWFKYVSLAMRNASPGGLGITADEFSSLFQAVYVEAKPSLSLYEIALANNLLEQSTPKSLDIIMEEYISIQKHVEAIARAWNDKAGVIRKEVQVKINEEEKALAAFDKGNPLRAVKAEA